MFGILAKFFRFSGRENGNKFKLSMVIGLIEALASAMKIPAIMYILIGLLSGKTDRKIYWRLRCDYGLCNCSRRNL